MSKVSTSKRLVALTAILQDICDYSSIHGLHYLAEGSMKSRMLWAFAIMLSFALTTLFMGALWSQYAAGATEVRVLSTRQPVYGRPFPAVYVCPDGHFRIEVVESAVVRWLKLPTPLSDVHVQGVHAFARLMERQMYGAWYFLAEEHITVRSSFGNKSKLLDTLNVEELMEKSFPDLRGWMVWCMWHSTAYNCSNLFKVHRRMDRWCYVFNSNILKDRRGLNCHTAEESEPRCDVRYGTIAGPGSGVNLIFNGSGRGSTEARIWIGLYYPYDVPGLKSDTLVRARPGEEVRILLSTSTTYVGAALYSIPRNIRGCRYVSPYTNDRTYYSQTECMEDMVYRALKDFCGCVPIPIKAAIESRAHTLNDSTCVFSDLPCMFEFVLPKHGILFREKMDKTCLPSCKDTTYNGIMKVNPADAEVLSSICPACFFVDIYFGDLSRGVVYERRRAVSQSSIFLKTSGVLGLLLGCSCFVFSEIIYFAARFLKALICGPSIKKVHL